MRLSPIAALPAALLFCALPGAAQIQGCNQSKSISVQLKERNIVVQQIGNAVLFQSGMQIDVDGAPNAYGPRNTGLDFTANARNGAAWAGLATDINGNPVVQATGPYQGYYISTTSLQASGGNRADPSTYVDATQIPYIALPPEFVKQFGISLGDLALVTSATTGKSAYAIYADVGPHGKIGEGSVALANALGLNSDPRGGGVSSGIQFLVFPNSGLGKGRLRTLEEINDSASKLYSKWGGDDHMQACSPEKFKVSSPSISSSISADTNSQIGDDEYRREFDALAARKKADEDTIGRCFDTDTQCRTACESVQLFIACIKRCDATMQQCEVAPNADIDKVMEAFHDLAVRHSAH